MFYSLLGDFCTLKIQVLLSFFFDVGRNIHVEHYANMDKTRSGNFLCFKGGQEADDNLLQFSV